MISHINTAEVDNIAKELSSLVNDLDAEFNALFTRFSNVPTVTREWVGNQANFYFKKTALDKQRYTLFTNELRKISQELSAEASSAQNYIKANNN